MQIFTCSTLRPFGVLSVTSSTSEKIVFTLTTGRTTAASHSTSVTQKNNASSGTPKRIYRLMVMVANSSIGVGLVMAGRNKSITQTITK